MDMITNAKTLRSIIYDNFGRWAQTSLCVTRNHLKEWYLRKKKRPNHFPRHFFFHKYIYIFSCLSITCITNIWLEVYFEINFKIDC
jgi:hypothetical protein